MLILSVSACLFTIAIRCAVSQEVPTCPALLSLRTDTLYDCVFKNNDASDKTVICDLYDKVQDHEAFVVHSFFFHMHMTFEVIEPLNSSHVCMRLSSIFVNRLADDSVYTKIKYGDLSPDFYIFLKYVDSGYLKADFNFSIPVAVLVRNEDCQYEQNNTCNPVNHVKFLIEVEKPASAQELFNGVFWGKLKKWYYFLGGYSTRMQLDFDPKSGVIRSQFLPPIFSGLDMKYLRLTGGNWGHLDKMFLDNMISLQILDISNNKIDSMDNDIFHHTSELEVLILADNVLQELPTGLKNLEHLRHIDLSNNPIKINSDLYEIIKLSSLKQLNLAHIKLNNLENLKPLLSTCEIDFKLNVLNLSYCGIQSLSNEDFLCQNELKVVDLSHNKLKEIPSEIMSNQKYLVALNISNNTLTTYPQLILHYNITILDISENKLHHIENMIHRGKVQFLDLSENNISVWSNANIFEDRVENLNLSHNRISYLTKEMIDSLKNLDSVDLGANVFDCLDCSLPKLQEWLRTENVTMIYNLGYEEQLKCVVPVTDQGKYIVEVDFDEMMCMTNFLLFIGVPVTVILIIVTMSIGILYFYRFEATYLIHLINMKKRNVKLRNDSAAYKYDAFVCYSGPDRPWVIGELMPKLESKPNKYRLCLHERDFPLGAFIMENIVNSLQTSRYTIIVLTNNFIKSEWCKLELELANHKLFEDNQEFLILIELERLDRTLLPRHLKYLMDTRTYLEWPQNSESSEQAWRRLMEALGPSMRRTQRESTTDIPLS